MHQLKMQTAERPPLGIVVALHQQLAPRRRVGGCAEGSDRLKDRGPQLFDPAAAAAVNLKMLNQVDTKTIYIRQNRPDDLLQG